jgi:S-adenosylmethionine decarboxylase
MSPPVSAPPYDGRHLLADLHGCSGLADAPLIERALRDAATAAGATLLTLNLHHFGEGQGVTGVALLAESHITIHTWPEHGYAALDLFLCGAKHDVDAALDAITHRLTPERIVRKLVERGYGAASALQDNLG